jgi:hypothetical protein
MIGRALVEIARRVRLVGCATPTNLAPELARVHAAWAAGAACAPRFAYPPRPDLSAERAELEAASRRAGGPHRALFAERAAELCVEAAACELAGTDGFWSRARERYPRRDAFDADADRAAAAWAQAPAGPPPGETILSDDASDPRSLLCSMRRAAGAHRLPFRVHVSARLAALAATGDGVIFVAAGRAMTEADTARTVLHEVHGHALPSARAAISALPILRAGTAFGSDDQEGRALVLEDGAGFLDGARRRELALRHLAARSVEARADFVETTRLLRRLGAGIEQALRIAARVHRGGGLGREATYLPAYFRVRAALAEDPTLDAVLAAGRVSVGAARAIVAMRV